MGTITSPSGQKYNWANTNPPTEAVFKSIADYEAAQGISAQPKTQGPATIAEMRRRNEQIDQGPPQVGQPFPLANRPQSPVGSLEQLNLAVEKSGNIGRVGRTNFNFSQNEAPVDYNDPKF